LERIDPGLWRGAYAVRITRMNRQIPLRPKPEVHLGDIVRLIGLPRSVEKVAEELGYTLKPSDAVDYLYLALGIVAGILLGSIETTAD
jgi:uncharacterized transporter YbjL